MQDITVRRIAEFVKTVRNHPRDVLLVLIAFDGVLAEYEDDPRRVRLPRGRRRLLQRLIDAGAVVGIVSGRRVRDLRRRVGLSGQVFYIGLHGIEVVGPGFTRIEHGTIEAYRDQLREVASNLEPAFSRIAGVYVEDKEAALALHTRQAGSVDAIWARLHLLSSAATLVNTRALRVVRGNHVLELLPNIGHVRARAITELRGYLECRYRQPVFTVYVGEDVPDDDAYEAVAGRGISAVVGRRSSQVDCHLDSVEAVEQLVVELTGSRAAATADR